MLNNLDLEVIFNQFEALVWLTISIGILIRTIVQKMQRVPVPVPQLILIPAFSVFGFSDLIEAQTGAWWTPWWLLVMKGLCVMVFLALFINHLKNRRKA